MTFLAPGWLWLGLLAIPILILYMLRLRRREVPVSSILLWRMLLRDQQANAPWQKLERNLLLFLQLLALAGLVLALARPTWPVPSLVSGSVVVILDGSASMLADGGETGASRFEQARAAALELVGDLPGSARMSIVLAGNPPQIIAAGEGGSDGAVRLRAALDASQAAPVEADWQATLALAAGAASAPGLTAEGAEFILISDGGLVLSSQEASASPLSTGLRLPGRVRYLPVGGAVTGEIDADGTPVSGPPNVAVSALALRPASPASPASPAGIQLFAQVHNYSVGFQQAILAIYRQTGDSPETLLDARPIELAPGEISGGSPGQSAQFRRPLYCPPDSPI